MFDFAFAEFVQMRLPVSVMTEILRDALRKQNVSGIATIHHALRHVDAYAGDIGPLVYIRRCC